MKRITLVTLLVFIVAIFSPAIASAKALQEDKVVLGGSFVLRSGETLDGDLLILGGAVDLQERSEVTGDVVLLGGTLQVSGRVDGNLVSLGGVIDLNDAAEVRGDLVTMATVVNRAQAARVLGQVITGFRFPRQFSLPSEVQTPLMSEVGFQLAPFWQAMWFLLRTFLWSALALLIVMFLPNATQRVTRAFVAQPFLSGGLGLLTAIVAPFLLIGIAITILLIPISLIGALALALAWAFGRIALGLEVGRRLSATMNQSWTLPVSAGVGTFVLTLVVDGAHQLIPCVGWVFPTLAGLVGFGAVLLTRFGTQEYPPESGAISTTSSAMLKPPPLGKEDEFGQPVSEQGDEGAPLGR